MTRRARTYVFIIAAVVLLVTGCGTTVPLYNTAGNGIQASGSGLGTATSGSSSGTGLGSQSAGTSSAGVGGSGLSAPAVAGQPSGPGSTPGSGSAYSSGSSSGSSPGSVSASAPGVGSGPSTAAGSKGPIQIGFVVTNVSNAGSFGVNTGQSFSDQQLYSGLVAAINAHGGLDGRRITPVYGVTDTADTCWSCDFQAACATFTQDHHVQAVIGYIFVFTDSFEQCLTRAGVPHLYGGYQPGDAAEQRAYPYLIATSNPTSQLVWSTGLSGAIESGLLTPKDKLGIIVDTCANDDKAFAQVGAPYLSAHHITYTTFTEDCGQGSGGDGTAASQIQSAELQFRSSGVNTVWVSGVAALVFAEDAETQGWHPTYLLTSGGAAFEGNLPTDQLANFHGFGWSPDVDVDPQHQPYPWNASQQRCLSLLASQGLVPKGYNDYMEAFTTCDGLFLYAEGLSADGDQPAASQIVPAIEAQIPQTVLASVYGGRGQYNSDQHGGPSEWRQWGWVSSCSCFEYSGPVHPLG